MKRICSLVLSFISLYSCSLSEFSKDQEIKSQSDSKQFAVTVSELKATLIHGQQPGQTRAETVRIDPVVTEGDTVLYLVHYKNGWKLFSTDKRTSPVLAYSTKEDLNEDLLKKNPFLQKWLDLQCRQVRQLRTKTDGEINPFWLYETNREGTRSHEPDEPGWRLIHVGDTLIYYDQIDHIIETKWGQTEPWNECTPYLSTDIALKSATGCVNVAFAQVLYWAHNEYGVPTYMYTNASCSGYINYYQQYNFSFIDSSATAWSQIKLNSASSGNPDYAGYLMAKVSRLDSTYYDYDIFPMTISRRTGSVCNSMTVASIVDYFGLNATYLSYNRADVITELRNGRPVIISAYEDHNEENHTWIIDGYDNSTRRTKFFYIWDPEHTYIPPSGEVEEEEEEPYDPNNYYGSGYSFAFPNGYETMTMEYTLNDEYYLMNWGWDGNGDGVHYDVYSPLWTNQSLSYSSNTAHIVTGFAPSL